MSNITLDGNHTKPEPPARIPTPNDPLRGRGPAKEFALERLRKAEELRKRNVQAQQKSYNEQQQREMRTEHEHVVPTAYGVPMEDENYRYLTMENPDRRQVYMMKQKGWEVCEPNEHPLVDVENKIVVIRKKLDLDRIEYSQAVVELSEYVGDYRFSPTDGDIGSFAMDKDQTRKGRGGSLETLYNRLPEVSENEEVFIPNEQ